MNEEQEIRMRTLELAVRLLSQEAGPPSFLRVVAMAAAYERYVTGMCQRCQHPMRLHDSGGCSLRCSCTIEGQGT